MSKLNIRVEVNDPDYEMYLGVMYTMLSCGDTVYAVVQDEQGFLAPVDIKHVRVINPEKTA